MAESEAPVDGVDGSGAGSEREPLVVHGVEVDFPFRPYPSQLVYMEKVVESLQRVCCYSNL